jgi:hypothetical protein
VNPQEQEHQLREAAERVLAAVPRPRLSPHYALATPADGCQPSTCGICDTPLGPEHLHAYYDQTIDLSALDALPAAVRASAQRLNESYLIKAVAAGLCSEVCALRWLAGEPTIDEREYAMQFPASFLIAEGEHAVAVLDRAKE